MGMVYLALCDGILVWISSVSRASFGYDGCMRSRAGIASGVRWISLLGIGMHSGCGWTLRKRLQGC